MENQEKLDEARGGPPPTNLNAMQKGAISKTAQIAQRQTRSATRRHKEVDKARNILDAPAFSHFRALERQPQIPHCETEKVRQLSEIIDFEDNDPHNRNDGNTNQDSSSDSSNDDDYDTVRKNTTCISPHRESLQARNPRRSLQLQFDKCLAEDMYNMYNLDRKPENKPYKVTRNELNQGRFSQYKPNEHEQNVNSYKHNEQGNMVPSRQIHNNTVVYRMPIDMKNMPTYNGTSNINPKEYIKRLETWLDEQQIQPNEYTSWAKKTLRGPAKLWDEIFCDDIRSYRNWKQEFLQKYWSRSKQQQALMEIYNGKFSQAENTEMATYFLKTIRKIKEIDLISIDEGIGLVINHYPISIARILTSLNPRTVENIYEVLEQFDNLENRNKTNRNNNHFNNTPLDNTRPHNTTTRIPDRYDNHSFRNNHSYQKQYDSGNRYNQNGNTNQYNRNSRPDNNNTRKHDYDQRNYSYQNRDSQKGNTQNRTYTQKNYTSPHQRESYKEATRQSHYKPERQYNINTVQAERFNNDTTFNRERRYDIADKSRHEKLHEIHTVEDRHEYESGNEK